MGIGTTHLGKVFDIDLQNLKMVILFLLQQVQQHLHDPEHWSGDLRDDCRIHQGRLAQLGSRQGGVAEGRKVRPFKK